MRTHRIIPLPLAWIENDMSAFTYRFNYGKAVRLPIVCWYIEGGDKRILVDTGANAELVTEFRGFPTESIFTFEQALKERAGLEPEDIDIVIQTHLQWDHCANTHKCVNAELIVTETEMNFALAPHPILAPTYKADLFRDLKFKLVNGNYEVAPGIELTPAPGHTPGVQAVCVNTEKGKAIITGMCIIKENLYPPPEVRKFMPVIAPGIHLDAVEAFKSTLRIKGMGDILIPMHDPSYAEIKSIP
jgi:N-acyl homoserine lactone hydrolase